MGDYDHLLGSLVSDSPIMLMKVGNKIEDFAKDTAVPATKSFISRHKFEITWVIIGLGLGLLFYFMFHKPVVKENITLKGKIEDLIKAHEKTISDINTKYEKEKESLELAHKLKLIRLKTEYDTKIKDIERRKREELANADTPDEKVQLGINIINYYRSLPAVTDNTSQWHRI